MFRDSLIPPLGKMYYGPNDVCGVPTPEREPASLPVVESRDGEASPTHASSEPTQGHSPQTERETGTGVSGSERPCFKTRTSAIVTRYGLAVYPASSAESIARAIQNAPVRRPQD